MALAAAAGSFKGVIARRGIGGSVTASARHETAEHYGEAGRLRQLPAC